MNLARTLLSLVASFAIASGARAQAMFSDVNRPDEPTEAFLALPYIFSSESTEFGGGVGIATLGYGQETLAITATAFGSVNGSAGAIFVNRNLRLGSQSRFFVDSNFLFGYYGRIKSYVDGNPNFPDERAGSNESSQLNFIEHPGHDHIAEIRFKYLLPIGHARDTIVHHYFLDHGLLAKNPSGGTSWDPFESGRTTLSITPFYRRMDVGSATGVDKQDSSGLEFQLERNNTDLPINPRTGSYQRFSFFRDGEVLGSEGTWSKFEIQWGKFVPLGESGWFRDQVLAFDIFTSDIPTWDDGNRPPHFNASTLGGYFRLRGYPSLRFHDRSAVHYSAEYRVIPRWNALEGVGFEWWQFSLFADVGRVAPSYNFRELHSNMRYNIGLGIRGLADYLVLRADLAYGDEGLEIQLMAGHPW